MDISDVVYGELVTSIVVLIQCSLAAINIVGPHDPHAGPFQRLSNKTDAGEELSRFGREQVRGLGCRRPPRTVGIAHLTLVRTGSQHYRRLLRPIGVSPNDSRGSACQG